MQIHTLQPFHPLKRRKRVGRGGKRGTYSGRGQKGQKSRAGRRIKPAQREMILKFPKRRGAHFSSVREKPVVVNLEVIDRYYQEGEIVNPHTLFERGLIKKFGNRIPRVKILGNGALSKTVRFEQVQMSSSVAKRVGVLKHET